MKIKHAAGILLAVLTLSFAAQAEDFTVDKDGFTEGTMDYHGYTIIMDALVDVNFPSPLMEVQLTGDGLTKKQIMDAAKQCFKVAPNKTIATFYSTFRFGQGEDSVSSDAIPFRQVHPVTNPVLQKRLQVCYAFCDLLGIQYPNVPVHAVYFIERTSGGFLEITPQEAQATEDAYIGIRIPIMIEGMPIDYMWVCSFGWGKTPTEEASIEYPYVSLAFDPEGRFVSAMLSHYNVAATHPLEGTPIPWTDAVIAALDVAFDRYLEKPETRQAFFEEFDIHITRVQAVWFANWVALLRPGYLVTFEIYDKATGEFVSPMAYRHNLKLSYGIEAITGTPSEDYLQFPN